MKSLNNTAAHVISISRSYHDSIDIYHKHLAKIIGVVLLPNIITVILSVALRGSVIASFAQISTAAQFFALSNINFFVVSLIVLGIIMVQILSLIALVYMIVHSEQVSIATAFEHSLAYVWRFVGLGLVVVVIYIVAECIGFMIVSLLGAGIRAYSLLWFSETFHWLTLLPYLITAVASTYIIFSAYAIVEKNYGVGEAVHHSLRLVHSHFLATALRLLLLYVVATILLGTFGIVPVIGDLLGLVTVVPFSTVYVYVLYKNLTQLAP